MKNKAQQLIEICEAKADGFRILRRVANNDPSLLNLGIANISAIVPGIDANKTKIVDAIKILKGDGVNMILFPEFCLAGYFWEDEEACWPYMEEAVIDNQKEWLKKEVEPLLDDTLQFIIFNNIRKGPSKKYMNSTYVVNAQDDYLDPKNIYDKTFLPGIENTYTETGQDDRLVIDTKWGKFGFTSCYDMCFSQIWQEYARIDEVDAIIELASWRGTAERDYPGMNTDTDTYYGYLWDLFCQSRSATNQVWMLAANAVGVHGISKAKFWGGSGVFAPSGMELLQASNADDELLVVKGLNIKGQKQVEKDDFDYSIDFNKIYKPIKGKRAFTRVFK